MSDSNDEDDVAGQQAMVANMLGPLNAKLKKTQKRLEKLEGSVEGLRKVGEEALPAVRKELDMGNTELSVKLERVQAELAQCVSKTALEVVQQAQTVSEQRLRSLVDEQRGKIAAQELLMHSYETRLASVESASRAAEVRVSSELSALASQLSQLNGSLERQRGEVEARLSEASSRASSQFDGMAGRLAQVEEDLLRLTGSAVTKADMAEIKASSVRQFEGCTAQVAVVQGQVRKAIEAVTTLKSYTATLASLRSLEELHAKLDAIATEARQLISKAAAASASTQASFEDCLAQRFLRVEAGANEARQDWHRLAAQLEQLQTYVSERALRAEHDQLAESVNALREASASKQDMHAVEDVARAAASNDALVELAADVRALQSQVREDAASNAETRARTASTAALEVVDERLLALQAQIELKISAKDAQFALSAKLEKGLGEQLKAEVGVMQQRLDALVERASGTEVGLESAEARVERSGTQMAQMDQQIDTVSANYRALLDESHRRDSDVHDLVKAVRALTCDAEMRCALDEREVEFLWAAPGHIYGQHGWRPNNGSRSERTAYPVGNFKMAVRHGGEGNAKDVLERRKRWLNSITLNRQQVDVEESAAIVAGVATGAPVRLPDIDELKRKGSHSPRLGSPSSPAAGSTVLGPAHSLLANHASTMGTGVGLHAGAGRTIGRPSDASSMTM